MMDLHDNLDIDSEVSVEADPTGRFDFLVGIDLDLIARVDELHSSPDHDTEYIWLFWIKNGDDVSDLMIKITENLKKTTHADDPNLWDGWRTFTELLGSQIIAVRVTL